MQDIDTFLTNAHSDDFAHEEELRGTFAGEPANEDSHSEGDDTSEFDGEGEPDDEPWDGFRTDAEADADALASAGMGTDEDYGYYGGDE